MQMNNEAGGHTQYELHDTHVILGDGDINMYRNSTTDPTHNVGVKRANIRWWQWCPSITHGLNPFSLCGL